MMAQDDDSLVAVIPLIEHHNFLERVSPHDDRIDAGNEFVIAVLCAVTAAIAHQPVKIAVRPRDESIQAHADKYRALRHGMIFLFHIPSPDCRYRNVTYRV